jgi:jumonji domain-containing protein 7
MLLDALIHATEEAKDLWIPKRIQEVDQITPLEFYRDYVGRNIPLVVRKGCAHWKTSHWTNEYLKNIKGNVTVAVTPDGLGDCIKDNVFVLPYEEQLSLGEFIELLPSRDKVHYIQKQCSSLVLEFPELLKDIEELDWAQTAFAQPPDAINFWMGDERAISSTHKDPYENIYCVVTGCKEFTLLPPTDLPYLYRKRYPVGQYTKDFCIDLLEEQVPWIPVDPDNPDMHKFPLFEHASPIVVRLYAGDVLYLPSLWFHKVKQSCDEQGRCIAVNFWYDMNFDQRYTWSVFQETINPLIHPDKRD